MRALLLWAILLVFAPLTRAQSSIGLETKQPPCAFHSDSNALENGLSSASEGTQLVANDILVAPGDVFTLHEIEVNFFSVSIISDADIAYYQDDNGLPGATINSMIDVIPTMIFYVGSFGVDVWKVIFELPEFDFVGQAGVETRYWISVSASNTEGNDAVFWETKSVGQQGFQPAINDNGAGWMLADTSGGQHMEGVYEFIGDCVLSSDDVTLPNFTLYPNPATDSVKCQYCQDVTGVTVYNLSGQQVAVFNTFSEEINISHLPNGMYFFELVGTGFRKTVTFIKN